MAGNRKVQRSVRVTVAAALMAVSTVGVVISVATATAVAAAAVGSLACGLGASRIIYSEVMQTRRTASRAAAAQARGFAHTIESARREHVGYVADLTSRLTERERTIGELQGTIRLADRRADLAEDRVKHEAKRANEAQQRLASLLDDLLVLGSLEDAEAEPSLADLPTIVDLLAWEDRANEATLTELRREA